ncbi:hypothetical protein ACLOJK_019237 [Asimina triloba]
MRELRLVCEKEVEIRQQKAMSAADSFRKSLQSVKVGLEENVVNQVKVCKLKDQLRELEGELVKSLAAKTCKEAKCIATTEVLSTAKSRTEELKKFVQDQRARRDEYSAIISQQVLALKELETKWNHEIDHLEHLEEAISWYNRILGFRIETGKGVKFIFNKIDADNLEKEYSFTIRHENNTYTLLTCEPCLEDTKQLMQELNQTNGLFKFVRTMRERFLVAANCGIVNQPSSPQPEYSVITVSTPTSDFLQSGSESLTKQNQSLIESEATPDRPVKKVNHGRGHKLETPSKRGSSLRRSLRLKAGKYGYSWAYYYF